VAQVVTSVLALSGMEAALRKDAEDMPEEGGDRLANVQELVTGAARYDEETAEPSLADFLQRVALTSDQDAVDENAGCVMLMTLHAAKGLEFDNVFIIGLEHGTLPHERTLRDPAQIEEERRLLFVGTTRARRRLSLSFADNRTIRGVPLARSRSQFLHDLPEGEILARSFVESPQRTSGFESGRHVVTDDDQRPPDEIAEEGRRPFGRRSGMRSARQPRARRAAEPTPQTVLPDDSPYADWTPGTIVHHAAYGVGQIAWLRAASGKTRAGVKFPGQDEKTFILELTPIRKLQRE
jgi:DNA helicase-2/ATP-dependent DNA helicase PcrA